jgi:hypothetical protein
MPLVCTATATELRSVLHGHHPSYLYRSFLMSFCSGRVLVHWVRTLTRFGLFVRVCKRGFDAAATPLPASAQRCLLSCLRGRPLRLLRFCCRRLAYLHLIAAPPAKRPGIARCYTTAAFCLDLWKAAFTHSAPAAEKDSWVVPWPYATCWPRLLRTCHCVLPSGVGSTGFSTCVWVLDSYFLVPYRCGFAFWFAGYRMPGL